MSKGSLYYSYYKFGKLARERVNSFDLQQLLPLISAIYFISRPIFSRSASWQIRDRMNFWAKGSFFIV